MPDVFEHYYESIGEDVARELELIRLDPGYKVSFEDGESLTITGNTKKDFGTFELIEPRSSAMLDSYLRNAEKIYNLATKYFLYNNFNSARNVLSTEVLAAGPRMVATVSKSIHDSVRSSFNSLKLQQVLEYPAVFLGASPFSAPAIYTLMSHLDFKQGVYYPMGGLYEIIESLVKIGTKLGVSYHYNAPATKIVTKAGKACGITVSGKKIDADIVISNADLHFSETKLLPKNLQTYPESYWKKRKPGPSAILLYLGIRGELMNFEHHNLFFTNEWETNFKKIFETKEWPEPASIYVCIPSKTDPTVAPKGMENMFVLVPGPAGARTGEAEIDRLVDSYIEQIAQMSTTPDLAKTDRRQTSFPAKQFFRTI